VNLIKLRKYWYILSLLIIIPGLVSLGNHGLKQGVDFTGGSLIEVKFDQAVDIEVVRSVLNDMDLAAGSQVQSSGDTVIIRTPSLDQTQSDSLLQALEEKLGKLDLLRNEKVDAIVSEELVSKATLALLIAFTLMLVYITIRFEFWFGLAAIVAILHDLLVTVGLTSLFRVEVDNATIAALLTIAAYSIHDKIVIFDRIRENLRMRKKGESLDELVHHSILQTLARSINTVLTVVICLMALILFGGVTLRSFMIVMLIGIVSGAYSSIFNASPLWYDFKRLRGEEAAR
jgi:preprotein translocase subunit SecF